jgi:acyl-CoA thioester hydrolase
MDDYPFAAQIRVRFADTDAQGVAHNSNYFIWFEVARVEFLERYAGGYQRLRDEGIESTVVEVNARYLAPARFDERLNVHARCVDRKRVSFRFEYLIERAGTPIAEGWSFHSVVDAQTLRPVRMPAWLEQAMEAAEAASTSA